MRIIVAGPAASREPRNVGAAAAGPHPVARRVAGNSLLAVIGNTALIAGPALAGVVTALAGPAIVIVADAATWAVLAVSYAWAARLMPGPPGLHHAPGAGDPAGAASGPGPGGRTPAAGQAPSGWRVIRASRILAGLLALTVIFYLLYGPVEVALPVYVASDLHRSAALLGAFWTAYAVGAVLGSFAAPLLRRLPVWPVMIGIVAGWGLALLPVGLGAPLTVSLAAFARGGVIYAPYTSVSVAVFQDASPAGAMVAVLAARSAWVIVSSPVGSAVGGPLVAVLGAGARCWPRRSPRSRSPWPRPGWPVPGWPVRGAGWLVPAAARPGRG